MFCLEGVRARLLASVKTLQTAARENVQETPRVIKFKTGVVRSQLLLSGVKVQFNQPPGKLSSSAGQQTQKHSKLIGICVDE